MFIFREGLFFIMFLLFDVFFVLAFPSFNAVFSAFGGLA